MNGKQLKNSILQWAIQGKLVPPVCRQAGKTLMTNPVPRDKGKECWFTYVIECEDGSFYKGFTDNLLRRYQQHCNGTGADYTKTHKPKQLYYWEMHYSKEAALQREKYLKSGAGREWFKKEVVDKPENFEPASVLLEKIRGEKERLIKEKKIKRDKNASIIYRGEDNSYYEKFLATGEVKCIDEEVPFEIPTSWSWARLTHVTFLIEDCPHSTAKDEGKGYPLVRTPNIGFGSLLLNGVHRVSEKVYNQRNVRAVPQKNDLIFAREAPAGNIAVIQDEKVCLGQRTVLLRPITHCIFPQYLAYFILAPSSQQSLVEKSSGTTVAHVNLSDFRPYLIAVPPIDEQKRIVNKLKELLPLLDKYNCYADKLSSLNNEINNLLKKSILQEAIQGKLVPQIDEEGSAQKLLEKIKAEKQKLFKEGKLKKSALNDSVIFRGDDNKYYENFGEDTVCIDEEIPFPIPNNWAWSRLSSMCSIVNGFTPLRSESKFWDCGTINWFTVEDIKNQGEIIYYTKQKITDEAVSKERMVRAGSVLLCCTASVGQCALAKIDLTTNQQFNALTVKDFNKSILTDNYLFWFAKTLKPTLLRLSGKTTFEFVSVKKVENILIPIPPFKEQQRIVAQIAKLFEQLH